MTGCALIVDAIATNRILLKVRIGHLFEKIEQCDGLDTAVASINTLQPDIIFVGTSVAGAETPSLFGALKSHAGGDVLTVAMIDGHNPHLRQALLQGGADDVFEKPFDRDLVSARLRSLIRARDARLELSMRTRTEFALGFSEPETHFEMATSVGVFGHVSLGSVPPDIHILHEPSARAGGAYPVTAHDVYIVDLDSSPPDYALQTIATLRSLSSHRHSGILAIAPEGAFELAAQSLDIGANDVVTKPFETTELILRLRRLIETKRNLDRLRDIYREGYEASIIDPMTGIYNRRYAMPHLERMIERARMDGKPVAVIIADLDRFKSVNDTYGHAAGDKVIIETARILTENLRAIDLVARIGGEEFLIAMPDTTAEAATRVANRLRDAMRSNSIHLDSERSLTCTMSMGIALSRPNATFEELLEEADKALYSAKREGRDRVTTQAVA